jgi:ABC-type glycerol-3-phosphate transport system substrate-binding protein
VIRMMIRLIGALLLVLALSAVSNAKADGALDTPTITHHCPKV